MMRPTRLAIAALLVLATSAAHAADPAVEALLKASGLSHDVDKDGDFTMVIEWDKDKRSQLVYLAGDIEDVAGVKVFTVFSPAHVFQGDAVIDAALARRLLVENGEYKVGAWEIAGKNLYFTSKIPAGITGPQLKTLVLAAAETADDMELELTPGKDDL